MLTQTHSSRNCVRCRKELTDAASMEVGIGPICRKLDNAILAATIPANVAAARFAFEGIPELPLSAVSETFYKVLSALQAGGKSDWRVEVKRMEWMLSFEAVRAVAYEGMLKTVRALGYVGLASLWEGEAATGLATVRYDAGRLFVKGPRNKAAINALRAIQGRRFHSDTKEWSVPAAQAEAFEAAIHAHYPVNTGLVVALGVAQNAAVAPAAVPAPVASPPKVASKVSIEVLGAVARVRSPYNSGFIWALKESLPHQARKWTGTAWEVVASYLPTVEQLVEKYYGEKAAYIGAVAPAPAPAAPVAPAPVTAPVKAAPPANVFDLLPF